MNILFINGSPNQNGNTATLASELLKGKEYETGRGNCYRIAAILAQYLRLGAKCAGSFLRLGRKRFVVGQNALLPLSRCSARKMDAGSRRIYDETLCRTLRNEICRYGN